MGRSAVRDERREARQLLAAGRALADLPMIDDAFAEGRLCWSKVRELVRVVTPQHEERWLKVALESRIADLALEVRLSKHGDPPRDRDDRKGLPEVRVRLNTLLPADVYAKWEQAHKKMQAGSDRPLEEWESLDAMLDVILADQSQPDASSYTVVVHPDTCCVETDDGELPIAESTAQMLRCEAEHHVPRWLRRKVLARNQHLDFYAPPELDEVIKRSKQRRGLEIDDRAAAELAEVSRQSPRERGRCATLPSRSAVRGSTWRSWP